MPHKAICNDCGHILYEGDELMQPRDIIESYSNYGTCPNCGRRLSSIPLDVGVGPAKPQTVGPRNKKRTYKKKAKRRKIIPTPILRKPQIVIEYWLSQTKKSAGMWYLRRMLSEKGYQRSIVMSRLLPPDKLGILRVDKKIDPETEKQIKALGYQIELK